MKHLSPSSRSHTPLLWILAMLTACSGGGGGGGGSSSGGTQLESCGSQLEGSWTLSTATAFGGPCEGAALLDGRRLTLECLGRLEGDDVDAYLPELENAVRTDIGVSASGGGTFFWAGPYLLTDVDRVVVIDLYQEDFSFIAFWNADGFFTRSLVQVYEGSAFDPDLGILPGAFPLCEAIVDIWSGDVELPERDEGLVVYANASDPRIVRATSPEGVVCDFYGTRDPDGIPSRVDTVTIADPDGATVRCDYEDLGHPTRTFAPNGSCYALDWLSEVAAALTATSPSGATQVSTIVDFSDSRGFAAGGGGSGRADTTGARRTQNYEPRRGRATLIVEPLAEMPVGESGSAAAWASGRRR